VRITIIDEHLQKQIDDLVHYAENNIVRFEDPPKAPIGDNENHVLCFQHYRCVYSHEENAYNKTTSERLICKHLSISLKPFTGVLPAIEEVLILMRTFNIADKFEDVDEIWIEEVEGLKMAVNVLKVIH
jgi:hypothetical protein